MRKNSPYSELFWSAFSRIRTEYGEIRSIQADQNNSEYKHFLRSAGNAFLLEVSLAPKWQSLMGLIFIFNKLPDREQAFISF